MPPDPGFVPTWGAALRGDLIEQHFWVPGLKASLPPGIELLYAGDKQQTLFDGYVSATPDGLLVGVEADCLAHLGVPHIINECMTSPHALLIECKSIDPRMNLRNPKPEHVFQVQIAMGVLRVATKYKPAYALLTYINASFLNDITEFAIRFDPVIYRAAKDRSRRIMGATDPSELPPEGKMAGGAECRYCAWSEQCLGAGAPCRQPQAWRVGEVRPRGWFPRFHHGVGRAPAPEIVDRPRPFRPGAVQSRAIRDPAPFCLHPICAWAAYLYRRLAGDDGDADDRHDGCGLPNG